MSLERYCYASALGFSHSQGQSHFTTGGLPPISSSWRQAPSVRPVFFFQLANYGYSPYVTFSLARWWVCRLQLLLAFACAVILRSESHGTRDHILLTKISDSPNLEGHIPVFISPRTEWPSYISRHWVSFRRLLRLAAIPWRYSYPPPYGVLGFNEGGYLFRLRIYSTHSNKIRSWMCILKTACKLIL
jgi:hypothetical protein